MDIMPALPALLLAIVIVAILGPSLVNAMIAVSIVYVPHFTRLTRSAVLTERAKPYVTASQRRRRRARAAYVRDCAAELHGAAHCPGERSASPPRSSMRPRSVSSASAPSRRRPNGGRCWPTRCNISSAPGGSLPCPALQFLITVLAFNLAGDGLRDALDPKMKR